MNHVKKNSLSPGLLTLIILIAGILIEQAPLFGQVQSTERRFVRVGTYQNHYSAYGSERAWNNSYYEGQIWPADYSLQDNAVIKRSWLACDDFTDAKGNQWAKYGVYFADGYTGDAIFPIELQQTAKFHAPNVFVDGDNISAPYLGDIDEINPNQIADRIVTNVVNTSMGLTMTRRIHAFTQQYHDDYHIKEYIFKNTGNVNYDDDIELTADLKGVYISWGIRYSVCREAANYISREQSWGKHTWVTRRGENYATMAGTPLTESTPIADLDWLRAGFAWAGQNQSNSFDNLGGPDKDRTGRLTAPHHAGIVTLHVDRSATDKTDDVNQPRVLGWHAGDTYPGLGNMRDVTPMIQLHEMLSGIPFEGKGGNNRFYETYISTNRDPWTVHNDGGGTNLWISYGPFDIPHGDSIRIVEAEGINGLDRIMCELIGKRWKQAYDNPSDSGPFNMPDGSTDNDKDVFKNAWFDTGKDSIMLVFSRAKRNFDGGFNIPQPPQPPQIFEVNSGGDRIALSWSASESENDPDFGGYRIFRAIAKYDTTYNEIFSCGKGTSNPLVNYYEDITPVRGFSYYYYIVAFNDGSNNADGIPNPAGELHSNRFYTRTTKPAFLRRKAGERLKDIRIVPNPYNIRAGEEYQYFGSGEDDKISFLNIPAFCRIKIYTERGDLIHTIEHTDGSGDESWTSLTSSRQVIVSGIYIAHIEVTEDYSNPATGQLLYKKGESIIKKFIVIR